jgi:hypothetical protein
MATEFQGWPSSTLRQLRITNENDRHNFMVLTGDTQPPFAEFRVTYVSSGIVFRMEPEDMLTLSAFLQTEAVRMLEASLCDGCDHPQHESGKCSVMIGTRGVRQEPILCGCKTSETSRA